MNSRENMAFVNSENYKPVKARKVGPVKWTEQVIVDMLREKHQGDEWAFFSQLKDGIWNDGKPVRIMDAYAMNVWVSKHIKIAYEIKTNRSDFAREIAHPEKRASALAFSNKYYFVMPSGIAKKSDMPKECGLIECYKGGLLRITKRAPKRVCDSLPMEFIMSLLRRSEREIHKEEHLEYKIATLKWRANKFKGNIDDYRRGYD